MVRFRFCFQKWIILMSNITLFFFHLQIKKAAWGYEAGLSSPICDTYEASNQTVYHPHYDLLA